MARVQRVSRYIPGGTAMDVSPVTWRGLPVPAEWQEIGAYNRPPLTHQLSTYVGVQRKCGVAGLSVNWAQPQLINPAGRQPWQQSKQLASYQGTQRFYATPSQPQPSRFTLFGLRRNITEQQVAQSGPSLLAFTQAQEANAQPGSGVGN